MTAATPEAVAPAEQVFTEFRLAAKRLPLESSVWDRKVDQ